MWKNEIYYYVFLYIKRRFLSFMLVKFVIYLNIIDDVSVILINLVSLIISLIRYVSGSIKLFISWFCDLFIFIVFIVC